MTGFVNTALLLTGLALLLGLLFVAFASIRWYFREKRRHLRMEMDMGMGRLDEMGRERKGRID